MIELYLVRHGETAYNKENRLIGGRSSHISINEVGIAQAQSLSYWLKKKRLYFDAVFCSTSLRALQTLDLLQVASPENTIYSNALEELSQGIWEGRDKASIYTEAQLSIINSNNYTFKAPEGESQEEVEQRMYKFIEENILQKTNRGRMLLVSHGTAIKCLLRKILGSNPEMTYKIHISNTGITKLHYIDTKGWFLNYLNATPHLMPID